MGCYTKDARNCLRKEKGVVVLIWSEAWYATYQNLKYKPLKIMYLGSGVFVFLEEMHNTRKATTQNELLVGVYVPYFHHTVQEGFFNFA